MDRKSIEIIIEHFKDQKWFMDALADRAKAQDRRNRRAAYMASRANEVIGKANRADLEKAIGKEFDEGGA